MIKSEQLSTHNFVVLHEGHWHDDPHLQEEPQQDLVAGELLVPEF